MNADFRSDTLTQATMGMRASMAAADVGDDVYGEDPTVNELQERIAALTGKESALFCTSGTQSNLSAVLSHGQRGDEYLIGENYHILLNEVSGASALGGMSPWPIKVDETGGINPLDVVSAIKEPDQHHPVTNLLCLENTVNGYVQPVELITELAETAHRSGLSVHLDGARLFNAAISLDVPISAFTKPVDTVSLCLSKGLGAPIGSVLAGSKETINKAFRVRKMLGGGTRQAGHLAAAGLYALDHHVDRLVEDHLRAERIAEGLLGITGLEVKQASNMLWVTPPSELHTDLCEYLEKMNVKVIPWNPTMRIVTHLDIDDSHADYLVQTFQNFFSSL
tara:strand:- start:3351 stop:4361 length:1011 start_codon:yes stop_codon:yes gene_type:complete